MNQPTMPSGATSFWLPLFTFVLGYLLKLLNDWVTHRSTLQREREARAAIRRDQLTERRIAFQRQTLIELQEAMADLIRAMGAGHHQDVMAYKRTGKWQKQKLSEDINDAQMLALRRTLILTVRVRDNLIRELAEQARDRASRTSLSQSKEEGDAEVSQMLPIFERLNQRIGEVLRELDDEDIKLMATQ